MEDYITWKLTYKYELGQIVCLTTAVQYVVGSGIFLFAVMSTLALVPTRFPFQLVTEALPSNYEAGQVTSM